MAYHGYCRKIWINLSKIGHKTRQQKSIFSAKDVTFSQMYTPKFLPFDGLAVSKVKTICLLQPGQI